MSILYRATNLFTGDFYLGVTQQGLAARISGHKWSMGRGQSRTHFHRALRKYSLDAFCWTVEAEFEDHAATLAAEAEAVTRLRPAYNTAAGGGGRSMQTTPETRRKLSMAAQGRKQGPYSPKTAEDKAKISAAVRASWVSSAKYAARKPRPVSAATNAKIAAAHLGRPNPRRPVVCVNDGRLFATFASAARAYGVKPGLVRLSAIYQRPTHNGLEFILQGGV